MNILEFLEDAKDKKIRLDREQMDKMYKRMVKNHSRLTFWRRWPREKSIWDFLTSTNGDNQL